MQDEWSYTTTPYAFMQRKETTLLRFLEISSSVRRISRFSSDATAEIQGKK
jgi:hypothetical protein